MEEEDLYAVLGIENGGPATQQAEIRKSYRARALLCHPDKRRDDAAAAALEFDKLQKAYEVLGDEKARKAYDELWKLRRERVEKEKQLSHKRQKMMQDLRERERAFEMESSSKREEEEASRRLKAEIARVRAMRSKKPFSAGFESFGNVHKPSGGGVKSRQGSIPTPAQASEVEKTLKATWSCEEGGGGGYTAARLREIFEEFGHVEDVVIRQSKSKRKGSALVVMGSKEAAQAASNMQCGDFSNPLVVGTVVPAQSANVTAAPTQPSRLNATVGSMYHSFENQILEKMKKAEERRRIIKEMQEADAKAA